jgi:hypothetical protein
MPWHVVYSRIRRRCAMPCHICTYLCDTPIKDRVDLTHLSMMCKPDAVSITGDTSPGCRTNEASSNSFCMSPLPKKPLPRTSAAVYTILGTCILSRDIHSPHAAIMTGPGGHDRAIDGITYRSPRFLADGQSLSVVARSPKLVEPLLILLS